MRVFNVRLAAILLGIAVVLGVGVYVLNRVMVQRNASFFKVESENAEQPRRGSRQKQGCRPGREGDRRTRSNT